MPLPSAGNKVDLRGVDGLAFSMLHNSLHENRNTQP